MCNWRQVSGNHRLDGNKVEIERCRVAGCDVSATLLEGKSVGPLRVWPGGLAMSRTLGDADVRPAFSCHLRLLFTPIAFCCCYVNL
jgi:hypothetical protein